jgi:predicted PurR-regulated permease PerM
MSTSQKSSNPLRRNFIVLMLAGVFICSLIMIRDFLTALIVAAVFAGLLYPAYRRLNHLFNERSVLAAGVTLTLAVLALGLPLAGLVSLIAKETLDISQQVPAPIQEVLSGEQSLAKNFPEWVPFVEKLEPFREQIRNNITQAATSLGSWLVGNIASATQDTLGVLLSLFILLYAMFYFLLKGPDILAYVKSLMPLSGDDRELVMDRGLSVTYASLKGIIIIGSIQGTLVGLAFWASGLSSPALWGVIVFVLSAIPGVGAPLVWLPATLYLMLTGSMGWGIGLVIWGALVVGLADNVLRPMVVGNDAKLPDLVILLSILGGITTFGALGIIIGPIVAAMLDTILNIYRRAFEDSLPS